MTGGFDAHDKVWRGLLHVLMDPQRFANKFFSQTLHIINSNAKGGLLAEATAFADPVKAEQDWANPSALILLEDGALSSDKPRIQERSRPSLPDGTFVMLKWCIDALGGVSGINPELLGSTTGDVPGVAQRQRQLQGMTINAGYFSALTRYELNSSIGSKVVQGPDASKPLVDRTYRPFRGLLDLARTCPYDGTYEVPKRCGGI
jgi:hypothetical protein